MAAIGMLPWRRILPVVGVVTGIAAALWFVFDAGRDSMAAKLQPRIDLAERERDAARGNVKALQDAIAARNAAIEIAAGKTKAAQDKAAEANRRAQERGKALAGVKAQLAEAARSVPTETGCVVQPVVRDAWGKLG